VHGDKRGFGGNAPNKLVARAEGEGSEHASDPCRRHGQKLVVLITGRLEKEGGIGK
jgi:hypothetical protein